MANYDGLASVKVTRDTGDVEYFSSLSTTTEAQVSMETRDLELGEDQFVKYVGGVSLELNDVADSNLMLVLGKRTRMADAVMDSESFDMTTGDAMKFPEGGLTDRYFKLKLTDTRIRRRWCLTAASFFGHMMRGAL